MEYYLILMSFKLCQHFIAIIIENVNWDKWIERTYSNFIAFIGETYTSYCFQMLGYYGLLMNLIYMLQFWSINDYYFVSKV